MKQFIHGNNKAFKDLEKRAKQACVRFRNQEMPPGCMPGKADIGFEINPSGTARLWVSLGINYNGQNPQIRQWLNSGHLEFPSFAELKKWICSTLAEEFQNNTYVANPNSITDMQAIHNTVKVMDKPFYLDEEELFNAISKRVLGQNEALKNLCGVMARHCARRNPKRPAVLFAVGPSGVGKTRTAEALSVVMQTMNTDDKGYDFLRLDMTEYQEVHRVSQIIGAPQGYIGHGQGSQLIDALKDNPRHIVLFDEIEKAHPAILKVLMNAMDAGRLSTASRSADGHQVDCRFAVFIFTSNLDAKEILSELTTKKAFGNRTVEDEVCRRRLHANGLAPEIVGRIGRFLVFKPLSTETRAEIIAIAISEIAQEYGVTVSYVEPTVVIDIMKKVRTQNFGVRPERFIIDDLLGGIFAKTAQGQVKNPVKVSGPPFKCCPATEAEDQKQKPAIRLIPDNRKPESKSDE